MRVDEEIIIFCENVKKLRKKNKLTQKEFSSKCDIGVGSIRLIEKGVLTERLSAGFIIKIYNEFGIKPSAMFAPWQDK